MTSQAGRQAAEKCRGGIEEGYPLARGSATFVLTYRHAKKRQKKKRKKRRKILEHISRLMPLSRVPVLPVLSGIIIIIFVISNLQHAHGISPASRSQKGSLSRSDNCPEQLLSTRPTQGKTWLSCAEPGNHIHIAPHLQPEHIPVCDSRLDEDEPGPELCASRLTIFKIHYN